MLHIEVDENGIIIDSAASGTSFEIAGEICGAVRNLYYVITQADEDAAEEFRFAVSDLLRHDGVAWDTSSMKKTGTGFYCTTAPDD